MATNSEDVQIAIQCGKCKKELKPDERPCSACGSATRHYSVTMTSRMVVTSSQLRAVAKDPSGFKKIEQTVRDKIARVSKRLAREILLFDRTASNVTRKFHKVEEQDEQGEWHVVHNEEKKYPARRRRR